MKKTAKIALVLTALLSAQSTAAFAEVSENLKINIDGVMSYYDDTDNLNSYAPKDTQNRTAERYFNNYTRLRVGYKVDPKTSFTARVHSGYSNSWDGVPDANDDGSQSTGAYFDQAYMSYYDKASNITVKAGKHGTYFGQGMVYNASGNLTGVSVTYGRYDEPTQVQLVYGNKSGGQNFKGIDASHEILPNVSLSASYLDYSGSSMKSYSNNAGSIKVNGSTYYLNNTGSIERSKYNNKIFSFGLESKMKGVTFVGEHANNSKSEGAAATGYYAELFTGPTNDMTGGLPYEKVGTKVFSLRYQDIGQYSVVCPTTGMYSNYKGWRVNYGCVITKGVSADIAFSHMKNKVYEPNRNRNMWVAEIAYKL